MPEIGTSGSMSGDGKRGVAEWPKLPRPSSTLPQRPRWRTTGVAAFRDSGWVANGAYEFSDYAADATIALNTAQSASGVRLAVVSSV